MLLKSPDLVAGRSAFGEAELYRRNRRNSNLPRFVTVSQERLVGVLNEAFQHLGQIRLTHRAMRCVVDVAPRTSPLVTGRVSVKRDGDIGAHIQA